MYASSSEFVTKDERMHELIQSEIQSDIINEKSLSLPARACGSVPFRSVKYTPPSNSSTFIFIAHRELVNEVFFKLSLQ